MPICPGSRCSWSSRFRRLLTSTRKLLGGRPALSAALLYMRKVLEFLSLSEAPPLWCRSFFDFR